MAASVETLIVGNAEHCRAAIARMSQRLGPRRGRWRPVDRGDGDRRRDRRGAECPALRDGDWNIAFGRLASRAEDAFVFGRVEPDPHGAVEHGGHGGHGPRATDRDDTPIERFGVGR